VNAGNLINFGHTKAGTQRRLCKTCGDTLTVTRGTLFYRRRTPQKHILEALAILADRGSIAATARVKRVKEDTVSSWARAAGEHREALGAVRWSTVSRRMSWPKWAVILPMCSLRTVRPSSRRGLTSRQINGRLVRRTLSFSKKVHMLEAASAWEDGVCNVSRAVKTLASEVNDGVRRWIPRTPATSS
jgi:transposase-like protein